MSLVTCGLCGAEVSNAVVRCGVDVCVLCRDLLGQEMHVADSKAWEQLRQLSEWRAKNTERVVSFLAISLVAWGRGETEAVARANCLKAGAKKGDRMLIKKNERAPWQKAPFVDDYGTSCWYGDLTDVCYYLKGKRFDGPVAKPRTA